MSLVGFTRIAEYELPVITGSSSDFVVLLNFADFTTAALALLDASGGDLRFSSDVAGTQLPCDVVSFDKIGNSIQVWVRIPSAFTGAVIHIWGDNTGVSQPAVGDAFGRNATWVDRAFQHNFKDTTDSTGNGYDLSTLDAGTTTGNVDSERGHYLDSITDSGAISAVGSKTFTATDSVMQTMWVRRSTNDYIYDFQEALCLWAGVDSFSTYISNEGVDANKTFVATGGGNTSGNIGGSALNLNQWYMLGFIFDQLNQEIRFYINGTLNYTITNYTDTSAGADQLILAQRSDEDDGLVGRLASLGGIVGFVSDDKIAAEYSNQSAVGAWGIMTDVVASETDQAITAINTEQLTQVQLVDVTQFNAINAIICEQVSQSQIVDLAENNQISAIVTEQKTEVSLSAIATINNISPIVVEQLTQSTTTSVNESQLVYAIQAQQLTEALAVVVSSDGAQDINVVVTEQKTQAQAVSVNELQQLQAIISEQLTQHSTQQINVDLTIDAIVAEQLTQAELVVIIQGEIATSLNIDIDQITLEILTPKYSIEMLTPTYTIEHIH